MADSRARRLASPERLAALAEPSRHADLWKDRHSPRPTKARPDRGRHEYHRLRRQALAEAEEQEKREVAAAKEREKAWREKKDAARRAKQQAKAAKQAEKLDAATVSAMTDRLYESAQKQRENKRHAQEASLKQEEAATGTLNAEKVLSLIHI